MNRMAIKVHMSSEADLTFYVTNILRVWTLANSLKSPSRRFPNRRPLKFWKLVSGGLKSNIGHCLGI
ncbi:hypothetical protein BgiMline_035264 [Biomphalaria glabrata]